MKALKFLKEFEKDINYFIDSFDEYSCDEGLHTAKIYKIKILEAIAELEALNNRSCNNCKYGMQYVNSEDFWCDNSVDVGMGTVYADFYCNRWESK